MKILSIETSCDETAISLVEATGILSSPNFKILGNALISQINIHKDFGGVFPMLAKREHSKNLVPILKDVFVQAGFFNQTQEEVNPELWMEAKEILLRENNLYDFLAKDFSKIARPKIDVIGVTTGPGLAPALWVGICFAKALGKIWNIPVVPINHMEGHLASVIINSQNSSPIDFPALGLLISGGHTELVKICEWQKYEIIGETLDDAVGEAFDKVARMLGLPYPGGPEISKLAEIARNKNLLHTAKLPRPMLHSHNLNFSFAGLKTAVLYYIRDHFKQEEDGVTYISEDEKADLTREFEDAVTEVLLCKTEKALEETGAQTLIIAGGVISNKKIKQAFLGLEVKFPDLKILFPEMNLATDNALMIAAATYIDVVTNPTILTSQANITAQGNLKLGK